MDTAVVARPPPKTTTQEKERNIMADLKMNMHSGRDVVKRYVVGLDENGKSALLMDGVPNQQELEDWFWRATLWKTRETPVDN